MAPPIIQVQIPQVAITDADSSSSRPQTPTPAPQSSAPTSPTLPPRMDSLKVDSPTWRKRTRSSSISTTDTLPIYSSGSDTPTAPCSRSRPRSNSTTPSLVPSYRTIPESHNSTIYHIYRQGGPKGHLSIHETPDKSLGLLPRATLPDGSPRPFPGFWRRTVSCAHPRTCRQPDHPGFDPRMPAYYVHRPCMPGFVRGVPMTLRVGANRWSPVACRFRENLGWRKWTFDFEDVNGEGVLDERGVVAEDFPRRFKRKGDGRVKIERGSCCIGKIGQCWSRGVKRQKKMEEKKMEEKEEKEVRTVDDDGGGEEEATAKTTGEAQTTTQTPNLRVDTSRSETSDVRHADKVEMTWENKLGREYSFTYKDIHFFWKGTSTLKDEHNKRWGAMNRFNHLKLIAQLPDTVDTDSPPPPRKSPSLSPDSAEKPGFLLRRCSSISSISSIFSKKSTTSTQPPPPKKELVVATYTCMWGRRKAGRLAVDDTAIEKLVQIIAAASPASFVPVPKRRSSSSRSDQLSPASMAPPSKKHHAHVFPTPRLQDCPVEVQDFERQRLRELVVATCVAMCNSEQEKRHMLIELTFLLAEIAQNAATG
ncbi:hypothetical protein DRE_04474 [Drechslerella stenobrocha 248]|uniref:Uncharacterized protein n=1 Tax=Drechslerella stenobrocha 248 TaxID=1043628 RepID=W7I209_9PEZI|nr:hypothetical protein DRE_04474 [Drechslerella stenobrocha 248]